MIVVDASVVVAVLSDDGAAGHHARDRLAGEVQLAPHLIDVEVMHALRGLTRVGAIEDDRADEAITDLQRLDITRVPHGLLLRRAWDLRANVTAYDGMYVALAEAMGVSVFTADARLAAAPGIRCDVEVLGSS